MCTLLEISRRRSYEHLPSRTFIRLLDLIRYEATVQCIGQTGLKNILLATAFQQISDKSSERQ